MIRKDLKSILIVNSEPGIAELFAEMLLMGDEKYILNIANTGKECLMAMKHNKPDLVLLDIELTDIDGWELLDTIKKKTEYPNVVIITSKPPDIDDFMRFSLVSDYLMKPVTLDGLLMAVKDALELPVLLDQCIKSLNKHKDKDEILLHLFLLLKQNIYDRKHYILMKQLYPDKVLSNNVEVKLKLENIRKNIHKAQDEINYFRNYKVLFA
jgi:CheY-like chemotaxis protein